MLREQEFRYFAGKPALSDLSALRFEQYYTGDLRCKIKKRRGAPAVELRSAATGGTNGDGRNGVVRKPMMKRLFVVAGAWTVVVLTASGYVHAIAGGQDPAGASSAGTREPAQPSAGSAGGASIVSSQRELLNRYCVSCHNQRAKSGNLALDDLDVTNVGAQPPTWEKVVRKLRAG